MLSPTTEPKEHKKPKEKKEKTPKVEKTEAEALGKVGYHVIIFIRQCSYDILCRTTKLPSLQLSRLLLSLPHPLPPLSRLPLSKRLSYPPPLSYLSPDLLPMIVFLLWLVERPLQPSLSQSRLRRHLVS
jgi:hypothetical protein